ncbi:hypothetical protein B9T24_10325 [Acinetobacter sp. ANC 4654]|uniref:hypothetical protein n=1 Tax=Acinetobacter sp. ANC 4654 TaxID=1977872 RepID=UPI000A356821|nr:hypothetical protein [Acinetobacter sp. ANC 4654]OTG95134.1 hypothetical protein B9T24_10325 [Acinetobacter sp. ANC 4654]
MIGHQRDILATLGIDIWIPKDAACQNMPSSSIWRDQAAPEYLTEIVIAKSQPKIAIVSQVEQPKILARTEPLTIPTLVIKEVPTEVAPLVVEERSLLQIAPFQLQAFGLPDCVIVVDATAMTAEQQQLWNNIQQALQAEYYELQWPFPLIDFQDSRGVCSYVHGFLDAISADKNIILIGQLPYLTDPKSINLASLQEMLDQPLLKKRLWQFMQKK